MARMALSARADAINYAQERNISCRCDVHQKIYSRICNISAHLHEWAVCWKTAERFSAARTRHGCASVTLRKPDYGAEPMMCRARKALNGESELVDQAYAQWRRHWVPIWWKRLRSMEVARRTIKQPKWVDLANRASRVRVAGADSRNIVTAKRRVVPEYRRSGVANGRWSTLRQHFDRSSVIHANHDWRRADCQWPKPRCLPYCCSRFADV